MDPRRGTRTVSDPKVRQVGFVTAKQPPPLPTQQPSPYCPAHGSEEVPASAAAAAAAAAATSSPSSSPVSDVSPASNTLSPVMIPPPRHSSLVSPSARGPPSPVRREGSGSVDTSFLATAVASTVADGEEEIAAGVSVAMEGALWKGTTSSLPAAVTADREMSTMVWGGAVAAAAAGGGGGGAGSLSSAINLTKVSEVKLPSGLTDKELIMDKGKGGTTDGQKEKTDGSKLKEKTSKAERRAMQEAQRAAKSAAKDADKELNMDKGKGRTTEGQKEKTGGSKLKEKTSKAERRAIQEAQRAAKSATKDAAASAKQPKDAKGQQKKEGSQTAASPATPDKKDADRLMEKDRKKEAPHPRMQFDDKSRVEKAKKRAIVNQSETSNRVELFRHLPQYVHGTLLPDLESKFFHLELMHPSVYKVGLKYLAGDITGGNARCIAMLLAFKDAIKDYSTPVEKTLNRDLTAKISSYVSFLIECRPLSISMGNAIRFLKNRIGKLPMNLSETEAKSTLLSDIDGFISEKIILADKVIVEHAVTKISDGDVLLTYGFSCVVEMIMLSAYERGKRFQVVVVDSRPKLEGQSLLRRLVAKGIQCTYAHINAISYIMHEVTRVFLGASSVFSNGTVYSRVGTACVALVAHAFRVPVLVCCEAYKFHNRVQLDSICSNELGNPDVIAKVPGRKDLNYLDNWTGNENLQLLNLSYDVMPSDYVDLVITDYGMVPPTSVPVILREYGRERTWTT